MPRIIGTLPQRLSWTVSHCRPDLQSMAYRSACLGLSLTAGQIYHANLTVAPVLDCLSLPARSTMQTLPQRLSWTVSHCRPDLPCKPYRSAGLGLSLTAGQIYQANLTVAPVLDCLSLPARSTMQTLPQRRSWTVSHCQPDLQSKPYCSAGL